MTAKTTPNKVLVIDGPSCAGKTHLAHALQQHLLPSIWLNFSIDSVVYTLPSSVLHDCNYNNNWDAVDMNAVIRGAFSCVNGLLKTGSNVIFDVVISSSRRAQELQEHFAGNDVFYVGLTADLDCLEQRARARKDRTVEEVQHGYRTSPKHLPYDVVIDTTEQDSEQIAALVLASMRARRFVQSANTSTSDHA